MGSGRASINLKSPAGSGVGLVKEDARNERAINMDSQGTDEPLKSVSEEPALL